MRFVLIILALSLLICVVNAGEVELTRSTVIYDDSVKVGDNLHIQWLTEVDNEEFAYTILHIPPEFGVTDESVEISCNKDIDFIIYPDQISIRSKSSESGQVICDIYKNI